MVIAPALEWLAASQAGARGGHGQVPMHIAAAIGRREVARHAIAQPAISARIMPKATAALAG